MALKSGSNISAQLANISSRTQAPKFNLNPAIQGFELGSLINTELERDHDMEKKERQAELDSLEAQTQETELRNQQARHYMGLQKQVDIANQALQLPEGSQARLDFFNSPDVVSVIGKRSEQDMTDAEIMATKDFLTQSLNPVQFMSNKTKKEIADIQSEDKRKETLVKASRLLFDQEEAARKANKLPEFMEKQINKELDIIHENETAAANQESLAAKLESVIQDGSGVIGKTSEYLKDLSGSQDIMSQLKQEYKRIRAAAVNQLLPQGPATDKDVAIIMSGFPDENANPAIVAETLKAMARLSRKRAQFSRFKQKYLGDRKTFKGLQEELDKLGEGDIITVAPGIQTSTTRLEEEARLRGMSTEELHQLIMQEAGGNP